MSPLARICVEPGCGAVLEPRVPRCARHERERRALRQARAIELIYDSPLWRNKTRPVVLERDGHRCVFCGSSVDLAVAHRASTQALLAAGLDVFDPDLCVTTCRRHNRRAAELGISNPKKISGSIAPTPARASPARETSSTALGVV